MIGKPIELLGRALPADVSQAIATATTKSIEAALKVALLLFCSPEAWTQQPLPMDRGEAVQCLTAANDLAIGALEAAGVNGGGPGVRLLKCPRTKPSKR